MSWSKSLIKLATYEVETLQKRLAEVSVEIDNKLAALARTIEALDHSGFEAARAELMTEAGREAMLAIRGTLEALIAQRVRAFIRQAADEEKNYSGKH